GLFSNGCYEFKKFPWINKPPLDRRVTFAEFRQYDAHAIQQRLIVYSLAKMEAERRQTALSFDNLAHAQRSFTYKDYLHMLNLSLKDRDYALAEECLQGLKFSSVKKRYYEQINMAFLYAMMDSVTDIICLMLEKGFPVNVNRSIVIKKKNDKKKIQLFPTYFMIAVYNGNEKVLKTMIKVKSNVKGLTKRGADVNHSWFGLTPLHIASYLNGVGNASIVSLLLENGADPGIGLPMTHFSYLRLLKFSRFLDDFTTPPDSPFINQSQPPKYTADNKFLKDRIIYPIEMAAAVRNMEAVTLMLQSKVDPKTFMPKCEIGLLIQQDLDITIRLLKAGAPIDCIDSMGNTPLHNAAAVGSVELVAVLIHFGAKVNQTNLDGKTPLHKAIENMHRKTLRVLIERGGDTSIMSNDGQTLVQSALKSGFSNEEIIDYFESKRSFDDDLQRQTDIPALLSRVKSLSDTRGQRQVLFKTGGKRLFTIERLNSSISKIPGLLRGNSGSSEDKGLSDSTPNSPVLRGRALSLATPNTTMEDQRRKNRSLSTYSEREPDPSLKSSASSFTSNFFRKQ
ncbi:ankyrin, partial [Rozella allomycis CSF55]